MPTTINRSNIAVFNSMLAALAYVLGKDSDQYFVSYEHREGGIEALERLPSFTEEELATPEFRDMASTFCDFAMEADTVCVNSIESECLFGHVFAHYTSDGKPLRFIAVKA